LKVNKQPFLGYFSTHLSVLAKTQQTKNKNI
jgi:hypothetical protein